MNQDKIKSLYAQRQTLREQRAPLVEQLGEIDQQISDLDLQADHLRYPCQCVRQNKELGIYDTGMQARLHRNGLTLGAVYNSLSADENCPICHGTGVPPEASTTEAHT